MMRLLLTLLALLTGLSVVGESAEARVCSSSEAELAWQDARPVGDCAIDAAPGIVLELPEMILLADAGSVGHAAAEVPALITVRLGADRARE